MLLTMCTERHVKFYERVIKQFTSQGAADFSQKHRDPGGGHDIMSEETWNSMSFAQKSSGKTRGGDDTDPARSDQREAHFMRAAKAAVLSGNYSLCLAANELNAPKPDAPMPIDVAKAIAAGIKH